MPGNILDRVIGLTPIQYTNLNRRIRDDYGFQRLCDLRRQFSVTMRVVHSNHPLPDRSYALIFNSPEEKLLFELAYL